MKKIIFTLFFVIGLLQNINAKEIFNRMQPGGQYIYLNFEFDPAFAFVLGYARSFEVKALNRNITLTGDITFPTFLLDLKHYKFEIGSRIALFDSKKWNVLNRLSLSNKGTDNPVYAGNLFSIEEGLLFGYFSNNWFVAGELDYEKYIMTHITHSDWYKEYVHSGAKDGWYSSTGGKFTFGLQGGYLFRDLFELTLRAGMYTTESFNNPAGVPFFTNLGANYHFK